VESKGAARRSPQFVGVLAKTPFCSLALSDEGNPSNGKEGRDESRPYTHGESRNNFRGAGLLWSALDNWNLDGERGRAGVRFLLFRDGQPSGRQSHLFLYQLQDGSYVAGVGEVRACCRWGTPCSLSLPTVQVCFVSRAGTS
jgi:hypothetical protein